jgi:hypothetical protein
MRISPVSRIGVLLAALCLCGQGQNTPGKDAPTEEKGLPPRLTPNDYPAQARAGAVTIAAEFKGHSVPTPPGPLSTEDYVMVEAGLFGPPDARIKLAAGDFSLRINGKRTPLPAQPFGLVTSSVKDPEWEPPEPPAGKKSKGGVSTGGGEGSSNDPPPPPPKPPLPVLRALAERVRKASMPEGDRPLPTAGVLFFEYRGAAKSIHSIELIYSGSAGKALLALQP